MLPHTGVDGVTAEEGHSAIDIGNDLLLLPPELSFMLNSIFNSAEEL